MTRQEREAPWSPGRRSERLSSQYSVRTRRDLDHKVATTARGALASALATWSSSWDGSTRSLRHVSLCPREIKSSYKYANYSTLRSSGVVSPSPSQGRQLPIYSPTRCRFLLHIFPAPDKAVFPTTPFEG